MLSVSYYKLSSMERASAAMTMRTAGRLFERTPSGITVVRAIGRESIIGTNYDESTFVKRGYSLSRTEQGLSVAVHRMYGVNSDSCEASSCFTMNFSEGDGVLEQHDGEEITTISRLSSLNQVHEGVELLAHSGRQLEHNPFADATALRDLRRLAEYHQEDPVPADALALVAADA